MASVTSVHDTRERAGRITRETVGISADLGSSDGRRGMVGGSLLLGGWRHREQHYNLQGANAYLGVIIPLTVLTLTLPKTEGLKPRKIAVTD